MWNLTNWQASNEMYWEYLGYAATRLNILYNSNIDETIKAIIQKIYDKIVSIISDNFQLLLFAQKADFGWNFKIDIANWSISGIRYVKSIFWDNLVKIFSQGRKHVKYKTQALSKYVQNKLSEVLV